MKRVLKEDWDYFDKFDSILDKYLPERGEGETMANQIVAAVNKIIYKWFNDGDVIDNTRHLKGWANDLSSYANWLNENVRPTRNALCNMRDAQTEVDYEAILEELADLCFDENFLEEYTQMEKAGSIYECGGPFRYIDKNYDEYDY